MKNFHRYGVYFLPEDGALADFGARWLGWDIVAGAFVEQMKHPEFDIVCLTHTPRKYGFHATIKAPFRLASDYDFKALDRAMEALCSSLCPLSFREMSLDGLGSFLALRPPEDHATLTHLAAEIVKRLDRFRAPLSKDELARYRQSRLSAKQEALLTKWGYPFVMEAFRFHITLSGFAPKEERQAAYNFLAPTLALIIPRPFEIKSLCLVGEDEAGYFHLINRYALFG